MVHPIVFLKEVQAEMKKVTWLSGSEVLNYTVLIIFISLVTGIYLGALDYVFSLVIKTILS